jgi:uncharacterized protein (DUF2344 family)
VKAEALSVEQKAFNKALASDRVVVEHTNSKVKKLCVFGDEFRNRLKFMNMLTEMFVVSNLSYCGILIS